MKKLLRQTRSIHPKFRFDLKMKLTTLLLLTALCTMNANTTYSQKNKATINIENTTIERFIDEIEKSTDFRFVYKIKDVNLKRKISISAKDELIQSILKRVFNKGKTTFSILENQIYLTKSKTSATPIRTIALVQSSISGAVLDNEGRPLPGANILEKGTTNGTQTDFDGNFTLAIDDENAVLVISYLGFATKEVSLNGQTSISVTLEEDAAGLEEVVVVGYGTQKKINLTGAVSVTSAEALEDRPITSLGQGLQGLLPNLNINFSDGAAGSAASFNIRGFTSTNGGGPLVLVDGVVMDPNILNPNEVASVSVLKDASAAAIYGSRAAFGVVLITTKKGKKNAKPLVEFSHNYSLNKPTEIPNLVNSQQLVQFREEKSKNLGTGDPFNTETKERLAAFFNDPENNPAAIIDPNDPTRYIYVGNTDWFETIFANSNPISQTNVSVKGGSDNLSYFVSAGNLNQKGILKFGNDSYTRSNIRGKFDFNVTDWLELNLNTVFTRTDKDAPYVYRGVGTLWHDLTRKNIFLPVTNPDGSNTESPVALLKDGGRDKTQTNDSWVTVGGVIKPLEGLKINGSYSFNAYNQHRNRHKKKVERYTGPSDLNDAGTVHTTPTALFLNDEINDYYAINIYAEYEKTFAEDHYFKAAVGFNEESKSFSFTNSSNTNLLTDELPSLSLTTGTPTASEFNISWGLQGYFYRLNYIFKDKYLLELSGRYDATSRFPKADRWAFFPSVSAGWRISNEPFFEGLKSVINDLKFRGSYGSLGNQSPDLNVDPEDLDFFPYLPTLNSFRPGTILNGNRPLSLRSPSLVSSSLTWETATTKNIGIDAALLNSRMQFSFDYYEREVVDQLGPATALPATLGTGAPQANAVESITKGWEFEIMWRDKIGELGYNIGFNIADSQGKITKYDNPTKSLSARFYEGQKIGEIWGYETNGLFDSRAEYVSSGLDYSNRTGLQIEGGDVWFVDQDGNNIIDNGVSTVDDPGDLKIIGNSTARYTYGISLGSQWKSFSIDVFMQGVGKRDLNLGGGLFWPDENGTPQVNHLNYWSEDNKGGYWPRVLGNQGGFNYATSDRYLQDFSYLRLKQLTINYALPNVLMEQSFIKSANIYFTGQNLFEIDNILDGFDPEISRDGFNGWGSGKSYAFARSYSLGLNFTF